MGRACSASFPTVDLPPSRSVASDCLERTLAMLATQTPGERALGLVDYRNLPSRRLVSSLGFVEVNLPGIGPDLGAWVIDLPG